MTFFKRAVDGQLVNVRLGRATAEGIDYGNGVETGEVRVRLHSVGAYGTPPAPKVRLHGIAAYGLPYVAPELEPEVFLRAHSLGPITL